MVKKIFKSRLVRLLFSLILIYFAFKKVDVISLFGEIKKIPLWFVLANVFLSFLFLTLISWRWTFLLFKDIKLKTILIFTRANFLAAFYSLFFPTVVAGDVLKWLVIDHKYPKVSKTKILASVLLDRFIGMSMFMFLGLISALIGKKSGLIIPNYIFYLLIILSIFCFLSYLIIYFFDVSKILPKIGFLKKLDKAFELLKKDNTGQIFKGLIMSFFSEIIWVLQMWLVAWKFGVNVGIIEIFVFMPLIAIVLILPISIGGFGAREQLYLFFFSQTGSSNESILLMATFLGILGVINSLFGGFLTFSDHETKKKIEVYKI